MTHQKRVNHTSLKILEAIDQLNFQDRAVSKTAVSEITGLSREHLSRRYGHLFK